MDVGVEHDVDWADIVNLLLKVRNALVWDRVVEFVKLRVDHVAGDNGKVKECLVAAPTVANRPLLLPLVEAEEATILIACDLAEKLLGLRRDWAEFQKILFGALVEG